MPIPEARLSIYLLMGQSNMAGRGTVEPIDEKPHPRIWAMDEDGQWSPAKEPLHNDKPDRVGVGPGFAFARTVVEDDPSVHIGLVPCAVGGSALARWEKHGDLYIHTIGLWKRATQRGDIAGVLWHQGESDAHQFLTANTYGDRLLRMFHDLRDDLDLPDLPIVVGTLGDHVARHDGYPATGVVNAALRQLPSKMRRVACIEANGLGHIGDELHFDAEAGREFGRRYAEAMLQMR